MVFRLTTYVSESVRRTGGIRVFPNGSDDGKGLVFYKGGARRVTRVSSIGSVKLCQRYIYRARNQTALHLSLPVPQAGDYRRRVGTRGGG